MRAWVGTVAILAAGLAGCDTTSYGTRVPDGGGSDDPFDGTVIPDGAEPMGDADASSAGDGDGSAPATGDASDAKAPECVPPSAWICDAGYSLPMPEGGAYCVTIHGGQFAGEMVGQWAPAECACVGTFTCACLAAAGEGGFDCPTGSVETSCADLPGGGPLVTCQ
jgi:hypothetical protein